MRNTSINDLSDELIASNLFQSEYYIYKYIQTLNNIFLQFFQLISSNTKSTPISEPTQINEIISTHFRSARTSRQKETKLGKSKVKQHKKVEK